LKCPGGTEENDAKTCRVSRCVSEDSNQASPKHSANPPIRLQNAAEGLASYLHYIRLKQVRLHDVQRKGSITTTMCVMNKA